MRGTTALLEVLPLREEEPRVLSESAIYRSPKKERNPSSESVDLPRTKSLELAINLQADKEKKRGGSKKFYAIFF